MKTLIKILGAALLALTLTIPISTLTGCGTTNAKPQAVAFRTFKAVQVAVDKAMIIYADKCVRGKVSLEKQQQIDSAHKTYRNEFRTAVGLARLDYSQPAPDVVQQLADALILAISQL